MKPRLDAFWRAQWAYDNALPDDHFDPCDIEDDADVDRDEDETYPEVAA